jgi:hypothetical protein
LRPGGLGTPYRESLSSYYLAVANFHRLSPKTLARELILPTREYETEPKGDDALTAWKIQSFNGIGAVPERWANRLSELTGQNALIDLTLVFLRPYTHRQRLMSAEKRWCPICLSESAKEGRMYGQLLWDVAAVTACPKHGIRLFSNCLCKEAAEPPSTWGGVHLSGFCQFCGRALTEDYKGRIKNASDDELKRSRLVAKLLGEMSRIKENTHRPKDAISRCLNDAASRLTGGNAALLGRLLGVKKNTLHGWMHGRFAPTFPELVEIAVTCGCSIADIISGQLSMSEDTLLSERVFLSSRPNRKKTHSLNFDVIRQKLEKLGAANPPISVSTAAKSLGVDRRTLFSHFRDIAQAMTCRVRENDARNKKMRFEKKCDLYRQSAVRLTKQGIRPTVRSVALDLKGISIVGGKERKACREICWEVRRCPR